MHMIESYDPSNGDLLGRVESLDTQDLQAVVSNAHRAAQSWRKMTIDERVRIIESAFEQANSHADELAVLLAQEMGKDIRRATGEVQGVLFGGPHIANAVRDALTTQRLNGTTRVEYRALGVAAVITPWNYPLAMANNLIVPALVAGNTVVFKPSEQTPLIAQSFVHHLNQVLPAGVLQIVFGDRDQGKALVEGDVNLIAFTGSMRAGKQIMASAATQLKRLIMELGGNDPMIVLADANLEHAARFAVASSYENAGQMCISTERIYVHDDIAEQFEARVQTIASGYKVGPWDMPGVNIGPMINDTQHQKVIEHIRDAEHKGARILLGGSEQPARYINPTVVCDLTPDMLMEQDETFGPVVAISRFSDLDDAIRRANAGAYGLGAVVFGDAEADAVADQLEAGMVGINQGVGGTSDSPWVGAKQSGFGYRGSAEGHRQFAQVRVVSK